MCGSFAVQILDVLKSKKFKDRKLESLYERYFFKLTQTSMTVIMAIICIVAVTQLVFYYISGATFPVSGIILGVIIIILLSLEVILSACFLAFFVCVYIQLKVEQKII